MKKQIVINASKDRSRIAIVEDGELVELYVENPDNVRTIGNIYLGKVEKVMPTLRAAFVDVGEKQDAFLHFSDLTDNFPQLLAMAGEDVPGLDEPVLALAPQKRIADDESEPDVEESLEVEPAAEEAEPSRSRSTRSRRSRGRGGRGARSGDGRSEEEEQEEADEEKPARSGRGTFVLDLTSKPRRPASAPAPAAKAAPPPPNEPAAGPSASEGATEDAESAPPARRAPRRTRAAAPADTPTESTTEAPASAPDTATTEAATPEPESAPRSRRTRAPRAAEPVAAEPAESAPETDTPEATPAETPTAGATPRPRRVPRGRATAKAAPTAETALPNADAPDDRVDTARAFREGADSAEAPASDVPAQTDDVTDEAPRARRSRSGRGRGRAADVTDASASDDTPGTTEGTDDAPDRSRRRTPSTAAPTETAAVADAPVAEPAEVPAPPAPPRPRGTTTIDLTSSARPKPAPVAPAPPVPSPSAPAASDDEPAEPRSRRAPRGRSPEPSADAAPEPRAEAPQEAAETDDQPRSRRGRGGARPEAAPEAETERPARATRSTDGRSSERASDASRREPAREGGREGGREGRRESGRDTAPAAPRDPGRRRVPIPPNEQLLRRDGHVIVKITKEPISSKGSRVSTDISLAGRFLVLVPAADYVAVSKKIESAKERRRLRTLAQSLKPANCGVIVRTVADGRDAKSLDTDLRLLIEKWRSIEAKLEGGKAKAPVLLYEDVNMVSSIIRDLFSEDFDRIIVDDPKVFKNVQAYVRAVAPDMADKVELHKSATPVYRAVGIEKQVEEAFSKRVNMKGGGYLFIETTEAMHVVDVNSGRAGRGKSQKENLIAVNLEAAHEVAKQLRLRDLGGIIVVDFIDLRLESDRRKITNALLEAFKKDRAVTKLLPMSDFGLVQITRQRLRPSITTQDEDGDDASADPADRAARAGAGEIAQTGRGRDRDADYGRGLDAGEAPETTDADRAPSRPAGRPARDERPAPADRARDERPAAEATTPEAITTRLRAWLDSYRKGVDERYRDRPVVVRVHPLLLAHLQRGFISTLTRWRLAVRGINWRVEEDASVDPLAFDVRDEKSGRSLLKKYAP